jgi:hypothetical protein
MAQYMETANEEEATEALRQFTIAKHYQDHWVPTSAPSTASFQSCACTSQEQVSENEFMNTDNGLFRPLFSYPSIPWLTTSSDGAPLSSSPYETTLPCPAQNYYPSPSHSAPSSSQLGGQPEPSMTPQEIQHWASNHNGLFLKSLRASVSALNFTVTARTPPLDNSGASSPGTPYMDYSGQNRNGNPSIAPIPAPASIPIPQYALTPVPHHFKPNNMVLERYGQPHAQPAQSSAGGNYLGHRSSTSNAREVLGLPDHKNCALFLTHIPVETTLHEIFNVIKTGAIFCLHINPPNGIHQTKAAKLAFMIPETAATFLAQINSINGIVLHGQRIRGRFNRNGYSLNKNTQSRVLLLEGPTPMMTLEYWTSHFAMWSEFELESYRLSPSRHGLSQMEFRFARIDGQAQTCLQVIVEDPTLQGVVQVAYGVDPCKPSMP